MKTERSRILLALGSLYLIWGSTFLAIRFALLGFPPLLLAGIRFTVAGALTYAWVVIAEQWVSSGVAAVAIGSVPLWVALMAGLFGRWPSRGEWAALAIGLAGVAILQTGGDLRASPAGAIVLTVSCVSWALGSIYSRRLPLPKGLMASGAQMLVGGLVMLLLAALRGERIATAPSAQAVLALAYLIVAGSIV